MGITAVVNQKGGVGKTTVTLGLASSLGASGRRALVVDLDSQANATTGLGVWEPSQTVDRVLLSDVPGSAMDAVEASGWPADALEVLPQVVPGSPGLAAVESQLMSDVIGAQDRLAVVLAGVAERYDEVLVDCPPSLGLLTVNALFAADRVLVVTEPAAWSLDGVEQIIRNVERIAFRRSGRPELAGIVVNRLGRTRDAGYWARELAAARPESVLPVAVKMRAVIAEAAAQSLPLHATNRSGTAEAVAEMDAVCVSVFGPPARPVDRHPPRWTSPAGPPPSPAVADVLAGREIS
jgi:chromosome partitioning protein